jgi:putative transposase
MGQPRPTCRYAISAADDEETSLRRIIALASQYGRPSYRRVTALPRGEGRLVNHKRVDRIWRQEGLKVLVKRPVRGHL